jgi:Flp pilus assembly protein CpaB
MLQHTLTDGWHTRLVTRVAVVLGACVLSVAGAASAGTDSAARARAQLHVLDTQPVVVRGVGFEAGERVQILLSTGGHSLWKTKLATPAGAFNVRFAASIGACGRYTLQAVGSRGSRARFFPRRAQLECVSPSTQLPDRSTT